MVTLIGLVSTNEMCEEVEETDPVDIDILEVDMEVPEI